MELGQNRVLKWFSNENNYAGIYRQYLKTIDKEVMDRSVHNPSYQIQLLVEVRRCLLQELGRLYDKSFL